MTRSNGGTWLESLKAKAGRNCYNCLSAGHRIADCGDPPRCILCLRFGHKARRCPSFSPAAASRAAVHAPHPSPTVASVSRVAASHQCVPAAAAPTPRVPTASAAAATPPVAAAFARLPMDRRWIPGVLGERPGHVHAGVARSDDIRARERDLEIYALIAVQVDSRVHLDTALVKSEAVRQLNVPFHELGVTRISAASFLLHFGTQQQRNAANLFNGLRIGHTGLHFMPWKRQVSSVALSKFLYRARLCIEGVPSHARHAKAVASLFKAPAFIDEVDCDVEKPEEEECLRLWLWTADPDGIATTGTLHIEEPVTLPDEGFADHLYELGMPMGAMRLEVARALEYKVIIHVDRVLDFSPSPACSPQRSFNSLISGHPDNDLEEE